MNGKLILAVALFFSTCGAIKFNSFKEVGRCEYWNDPHLVVFPSAPGAPKEQYLCFPNCTEVLVRNPFLEIFVRSDPTQHEYRIIEYTVIFFPTPQNPSPCVITDSIASPSPSSALTCPPGSPATSSGNSIHTTDDIIVTIKYAGNWFNFDITQTFSLIAQSTGVCIKPKCDAEYPAKDRKKRQTEPINPILSKIIDIYIEAGRRHVAGEIDKGLLESQRIAAEHDLSTSLDARYARSIVTAILHDSVRKDENAANFVEHLQKIAEAEKEVIREADQEVNKLIGSSERICKGEKEAQRCLQPVADLGKEGGRRRRRK